MSYILDALRKADAQRVRDPARGIHAQAIHPTTAGHDDRGSSSAWPWLAGGIAVAALVAGGWYVSRDRAQPEIAASAVQGAMTPTPASPSTPTSTSPSAPGAGPDAAPVVSPSAPVAVPVAAAVVQPPPAPRTVPPRDPTNTSQPTMRGMPQTERVPGNPVMGTPAATRAATAREATVVAQAGAPTAPTTPTAPGATGAQLPSASPQTSGAQGMVRGAVTPPGTVPPQGQGSAAPAPGVPAAPAAPGAQAVPGAATVPTAPPAPAAPPAAGVTPGVPAPAPLPAPARAPAPAPVAPAAAAPAPAPQATTGLPPDAPKISVSGGVYSNSPAQRMLIVNGQVFNEGSEVAPGVTVEEIKPRTAVLKFRGTRYTVAY